VETPPHHQHITILLLSWIGGVGVSSGRNFFSQFRSVEWTKTRLSLIWKALVQKKDEKEREREREREKKEKRKSGVTE